MPEIVARQDDRARVIQAAAELAGSGLAERMRLDAATRVLVTARRLLSVAPGAAMAGPGAAIVLRVARAWDVAALTAAEQVESLPPAELDEFLSVAPRWAAGVRDAESARLRAA